GVRSTPTTVANTTGATQVSAGNRHSCAVVGGRVICWGSPSEYAALGGTPLSTGNSIEVEGITNAVEVSVNDTHSCARLSTGAVMCWGANNYGQLGAGDYMTSATPRQAIGVTNAVSISTGWYYSCAAESTGAVKCWGYNAEGQSSGTAGLFFNTPYAVIASGGGSFVGARAFSTACATRANGTAACWGTNTNGQVGSGMTDSMPVGVTTVTGLSSVARVVSNGQSSCAVTTDGRGYCWGDNTGGKLGDGTTMQRTSPVEVLRP
ncbi:MAG TPA: hypothetical protein VGE37_15995, partial [Archangium sp.]